MTRTRIHTKRPRRASSKWVWAAAQRVLGQPPDRMVVVLAHAGKTTEWLIEVQGNVELQLMGNKDQVCAQLEAML